jgi:hypothetical protein
MSEPKPIREWRDVDEVTFRHEVFTQYQPAVLKGAVSRWPAVKRALESPESVAKYLKGFDRGAPVDVLMMPSHVKGRIFYDERMDGFTYTRDKLSISAVNEQLLRYAAFQNRPSVVIQSALIADCLPGFTHENKLALLDAAVQPRIWLGSAVVTPAHFDESNNIACVVAGQRRFTLFPPEQIANLYIGPLGHAPTGTPISLVNFREPDFGKFPRFREALGHAQVADLEPGDAIFIPTLWWHHVESLTKYNMLVNYWWKGGAGDTQSASALDSLLHALINLKHLPPEQRAAWRVIFDHYLFGADDPAAHIPEHKRGVLGKISPELDQQVRAFLAGRLQR